MGHVADRWWVADGDGRRVRTARHGVGKRWQAVWLDPTTRAERTRAFTVKDDAARHVSIMEADKARGTYVDPHAGAVTFAEFYAEWSTRQVWASTTVLAMDLAARSASFAPVPLAQLRRSHLESWVKAMDTAGLAPGTIRTRVNNVRSVLRAAVRDRLIPFDPSEQLTLPRDRRRETAMELPSSEVVGRLLNAAAPQFAPFVAVAAFAGLRLGEAAALRVGDVDWLRKRLMVTRQVQRTTGGGVEVRPPKYRSERVVFLAEDLVQVLAAHVATLDGEGSDRWLFVGEHGQPPHQNTVGYWWRKTCRAAGVEGMTLHQLRHYFASGLIAAGCDVVTVQRALGHAKATTTLSTYAHLWPTAEDRTRAAAEALMRNSHGPHTDRAAVTGA